MRDQALADLILLLDHARSTTPFYAARIPAAGDPPRHARELLEAVPLLSRSDVQREGPRLWSSEGDPAGWRTVRTTGTTGQPVELLVDAASQELEAELLADHVDRTLGTATWCARDLVHLVLHPGSRSSATPSPWRPDARVVKWNLLRAWHAGDDALLRALLHIHGNLVATMPSVLELICSRLAARKSDTEVTPLLVILSGEMLEPDVRYLAAEVLSCPITSLYTLAEAGIVGSECAETGGYHVEERSCVVELIDEFGHEVPPGVEGEVVVTPLANRAMPLLRYRTGDRAHWVARSCGCGRPSHLFALTDARRPARLLATSGATVNVVRFAKLFAGLDVNRISIEQPAEESVSVTYESERALDPLDRSLVTSAVRSALGARMGVSIRRDEGGVRRGRSPSRGAPPTASREGVRAEPADLDPDDVAAWLRTQLAGHGAIEAALITGSALDRAATTRFSDVDLVVLVRNDPDDPGWISLAQELRASLERLRVNVDRLDGLVDRAPLLACRLLKENLPVVGRLTPDRLSWPTPDGLRRQGVFWAQDAAAALWTRLTDPALARGDPVLDAWIASKYALDALRFRYLVRGARETGARAVLALAALESQRSEWVDRTIEAFDVAREQQPPPLMGSGASYLAAALACVNATATELGG